MRKIGKCPHGRREEKFIGGRKAARRMVIQGCQMYGYMLKYGTEGLSESLYGEMKYGKINLPKLNFSGEFQHFQFQYCSGRMVK